MNIYAFADETHSDVDLQIKAMLRNGLQGLEARNIDGTNVSVITLEKAKEVRKKMDDAGLVTWSIGSPIGKFKPWEQDWQAEQDKMKNTLEVADILGAKNIRMFSIYPEDPTQPEKYRDDIFEKIETYVSLAKGTGIQLCHENEKGIYGENWQRCLDILKTFPEIKGVFDPANFVQCGVNTLEAWANLKDYIHYMHIKDAMSDKNVVPAGCGEGHVKEIVTEYIKQGGTNFTMEPHLHKFSSFKTLEEKGQASIIGQKYIYEDGDAALDAAVSYFRAILKEIS